jgi:hypothetical protein
MKILRPLLIYMLLIGAGCELSLSGCKTTPEKEPEKAAAATPKKKPAPASFRNQSGDPAFQSFLSRLRKAVASRDIPAIADMMTKDFGYRLDPIGEGAGVFEYWNENNIWPELELVLNEQFLPKSNYMVAPAEFVLNEAEFTGYRVGIQLVNGSWKFAYFVAG